MQFQIQNLNNDYIFYNSHIDSDVSSIFNGLSDSYLFLSESVILEENVDFMAFISNFKIDYFFLSIDFLEIELFFSSVMLHKFDKNLHNNLLIDKNGFIAKDLFVILSYFFYIKYIHKVIKFFFLNSFFFLKLKTSYYLIDSVSIYYSFYNNHSFLLLLTSQLTIQLHLFFSDIDLLYLVEKYKFNSVDRHFYLSPFKYKESKKNNLVEKLKFFFQNTSVFNLKKKPIFQIEKKKKILFFQNTDTSNIFSYIFYMKSKINYNIKLCSNLCSSLVFCLSTINTKFSFFYYILPKLYYYSFLDLSTSFHFGVTNFYNINIMFSSIIKKTNNIYNYFCFFYSNTFLISKFFIFRGKKYNTNLIFDDSFYFLKSIFFFSPFFSINNLLSFSGIRPIFLVRFKQIGKRTISTPCFFPEHKKIKYIFQKITKVAKSMSFFFSDSLHSNPNSFDIYKIRRKKQFSTSQKMYIQKIFLDFENSYFFLSNGYRKIINRFSLLKEKHRISINTRLLYNNKKRKNIYFFFGGCLFSSFFLSFLGLSPLDRELKWTNEVVYFLRRRFVFPYFASLSLYTVPNQTRHLNYNYSRKRRIFLRGIHKTI